MLVEVVLLHLVHRCTYLSGCFFFVGLDGLNTGRIPGEVGIVGRRCGERGFHAVVSVGDGFHFEAEEGGTGAEDVLHDRDQLVLSLV